jgi:hypothetical protein
LPESASQIENFGVRSLCLLEDVVVLRKGGDPGEQEDPFTDTRVLADGPSFVALEFGSAKRVAAWIRGRRGKKRKKRITHDVV